jgi:hypothetical protein
MAGREDERRCPRCAAPYAEDQEYCLECGERIPAAPGLTTRLGNRWRRSVGWYPGDWIWPALLALVVAVAAGLLSALFLADESSSAGGTLVRTLERPSTEPQRQAPPEPTITAPTTTTATTGTTQRKPPPPPRKALVFWPAGKSGWTIVLDSVPATNGRAGAVAEAKQAARLGMKEVGVLDSSRFSSLHPGYFVVFAGIYDTEAEAQSHVIEAHRHGYRGPYPRPITP